MSHDVLAAFCVSSDILSEQLLFCADALASLDSKRSSLVRHQDKNVRLMRIGGVLDGYRYPRMLKSKTFAPCQISSATPLRHLL